MSLRGDTSRKESSVGSTNGREPSSQNSDKETTQRHQNEYSTEEGGSTPHEGSNSNERVGEPQELVEGERTDDSASESDRNPESGRKAEASSKSKSKGKSKGGDHARAGGKHERRGVGEEASECQRSSSSYPPDEDPKQSEEDRFNEIEKKARVALESIAVCDDDVESNMAYYVSTLKDYRLACEQRQMYKEAHLVLQVLRNLRLEEETRHVHGLTDMQMEARRVLEDAHRNEFREFHRLWNAKIDEFEEAQLEMEITLLERQNDELLKFHEEMRGFDPRGVPRFSRSLLATRQKQQALARQKSYVAAQEEKHRGDAIELVDIEKFENTRAQMYERREYALRYHHQQELFALRLRVESRRLFLEKARKRELDEMLQRYINARNEMEVQQNIVRNKTGNLLLKHAHNNKTDGSGSAALVESAYSGTYGTIIQQRALAEMQEHEREQANAKDRESQRLTPSSAPKSSQGAGASPAIADSQPQPSAKKRGHQSRNGERPEEGAAARVSADRQ